MKPAKFDYINPKTLDEALQALQIDDVKLIAGGQSLVPLMNYRLSQPSTIIDINSIKELSIIDVINETLEIGSLVTHNEAIKSKIINNYFPIITDAIGHTAHKTIRNSGTIGGSIAHADPAAEWPLLAMLLDCDINICNLQDNRSVKAKEFFISELTTDLNQNEIIKSFSFPLIKNEYGWAFEEIVKRSGDFAIIAVASIIEIINNVIVEIKICVGGVGETPIRLSNIEQMLKGKTIEDSFKEIKNNQITLLLKPNSDVHASAEYKLHIAPKIIKNVLIKSIQNYKENTNDKKM